MSCAAAVVAGTWRPRVQLVVTGWSNTAELMSETGEYLLVRSSGARARIRVGSRVSGAEGWPWFLCGRNSRYVRVAESGVLGQDHVMSSKGFGMTCERCASTESPRPPTSNHRRQSKSTSYDHSVCGRRMRPSFRRSS